MQAVHTPKYCPLYAKHSRVKEINHKESEEVAQFNADQTRQSPGDIYPSLTTVLPFPILLGPLQPPRHINHAACTRAANSGYCPLNTE